MIRDPFRSRLRYATPATIPGLPYWRTTTFLTCCAYYPGGPIRADGYCLKCAPAPGSSGSILPSPLQRRVGTTSDLSRPAQALHALRPARLLAHLSVDFVTRFRPDQFPDRTAR